MYTIELILKGNPLSLSVQRKEKADAESLYKSIVDAIQSGSPKLLELTCEKQEDKKLALLTSEITSIQISEKTSSSSSISSVGFARN